MSMVTASILTLHGATPRVGRNPAAASGSGQPGCRRARLACIVSLNKTRQGYARERILKPAGYSFVRPQPATSGCTGGMR